MSSSDSNGRCRDHLCATSRDCRGEEAVGRVVAAASVLNVREVRALRCLGSQLSWSVIWEGVRRGEQMGHERKRFRRVGQAEGGMRGMVGGVVPDGSRCRRARCRGCGSAILKKWTEGHAGRVIPRRDTCVKHEEEESDRSSRRRRG